MVSEPAPLWNPAIGAFEPVDPPEPSPDPPGTPTLEDLEVFETLKAEAEAMGTPEQWKARSEELEARIEDLKKQINRPQSPPERPSSPPAPEASPAEKAPEKPYRGSRRTQGEKLFELYQEAARILSEVDAEEVRRGLAHAFAGWLDRRGKRERVRFLDRLSDEDPELAERIVAERLKPGEPAQSDSPGQLSQGEPPQGESPKRIGAVSQENRAEAVQAVLAGESIRSASRRFHIPYASLRRWVKAARGAAEKGESR